MEPLGSAALRVCTWLGACTPCLARQKVLEKAALGRAPLRCPLCPCTCFGAAPSACSRFRLRSTLRSIDFGPPFRHSGEGRAMAVILPSRISLSISRLHFPLSLSLSFCQLFCRRRLAESKRAGLLLFKFSSDTWHSVLRHLRMGRRPSGGYCRCPKGQHVLHLLHSPAASRSPCLRCSLLVLPPCQNVSFPLHLAERQG